MPNVLGPYNEVFYAQEALRFLKKVLGFGSRVARNDLTRAEQRGSTVQWRRPMSFTATSMPSSATDLTPETVTLTLDQWYGVTFTITDKERAWVGDRIIEEHIAPAAYAVADMIDTTLAQRYKDVPWQGNVGTGTTFTTTHIVAARQKLVENKAPLNDGRLYLALTPQYTAEALNVQAFTQYTGSGPQGVEAQLSGSLGVRFGFNVFEHQQTQTHTAGVAADNAGALDGDHAKNATSLLIDGFEASGTLKAGDILVITGDSQYYCVTADATATAGVITVSITPALQQANANNAVVTATLASGQIGAVAFHREAFGLAMAQLPDMLPGVAVFTAVDESSGLSIRGRRWSDAANAASYIGLDALWGVKTLNPNLAYRIYDTP